MKIEVGQKYRIKKFKKRPQGWNNMGAMDYLMGKIVVVRGMAREHIWLERDPDGKDDRHSWVFRPSNFEPYLTDWDE